MDGIEADRMMYRVPVPSKPPRPSTLPYKYVERSQGNYGANTLISWLTGLPGWDWQRAESVARMYKVGTGAGDVQGWAIFWQIDHENKVRSGKMMKYNKNGHRAKDGYSQDWIHSKLARSGKLSEFELVQCLFGLHIANDSKPVAIVESEKTAIICSQYLPVFHWLASGQLHGINEYKLRPLRGRSITLFPDIGAFDLWSQKASELSHIGNLQVSKLLERNASDENKGFDLADYLIRFDLNRFKSGESGKSGSSEKVFSFTTDQAPHGFNMWTGEIFDSRGYPEEWDNLNLN